MPGFFRILCFTALLLRPLTSFAAGIGPFNPQYANPLFPLGCIDAFYDEAGEPFIAGFNESLIEEARKFNIAVRSFDALGQEELQLRQFNHTLADRCTKIVNIHEPYFSQTLVNLAKKFGYRLIFFNRKPDPEALNSYDNAWYVGSDSIEIGSIQGRMIADYLRAHPEFDRNHNGRLDLVFFKGRFGNVDTEFRSQTVIGELRRSGIKFERLKVYTGNWSQALAYEQMRSFIKQYGLKNVEAIIANNDAMALGAIAALRENGYNLGYYSLRIPVFGIDAIPEAVKALEQKILEGTVSHDYKKMAEICLRLEVSDETDPQAISRLIGLDVRDSYIMIPSRVKTISY